MKKLVRETVSAYYINVLVCVTMLLCSCGNSPFLPRPRGYFRIESSPPRYRVFNSPSLPYQFEYAANNAQILRDTSLFFNASHQNSYWRNIYFPRYGATIYLSYLDVNGFSLYKRKDADGIYRDSIAQNSFQSLLNQSYQLAYKHTPKASSIRDSTFKVKSGGGVVFNIAGNTATKYQFFVTDTHTHYLRGVLYFDAPPNEDSLLPLNELLAKDIRHLLKTLQWKAVSSK